MGWIMPTTMSNEYVEKVKLGTPVCSVYRYYDDIDDRKPKNVAMYIYSYNKQEKFEDGAIVMKFMSPFVEFMKKVTREGLTVEAIMEHFFNDKHEPISEDMAQVVLDDVLPSYGNYLIIPRNYVILTVAKPFTSITQLIDASETHREITKSGAASAIGRIIDNLFKVPVNEPDEVEQQTSFDVNDVAMQSVNTAPSGEVKVPCITGVEMNSIKELYDNGKAIDKFDKEQKELKEKAAAEAEAKKQAEQLEKEEKEKLVDPVDPEPVVDPEPTVDPVDPEPVIDPEPGVVDPEPEIIDPEPTVNPEPEIVDPEPTVDPEPSVIDPEPSIVDPEPVVDPTGTTEPEIIVDPISSGNDGPEIFVDPTPTEEPS